MPRKKSKPKKDLALGACSLSTIGEIYPVIKKKQRKGCYKRANPRYQLIKPTEFQQEYHLGDLRVGSSNNVIPDDFTSSCTVSFRKLQNSAVFCSNGENIIVHVLDDFQLVKDIISSRELVFQPYHQDEFLYLKVYLSEIPLTKFTTTTSKAIKACFNVFYNIQVEDPPSVAENFDLNNVYERLIESRQAINCTTMNKDSLSYLNPILRPYQESALQWMIHRETNSATESNLHPLYQIITLKSGLSVYYDKYAGWIQIEPPFIDTQWRGGILADEMGLGKTVEVLALILSNRLKKDISNDSPLSMHRQKRKIVKASQDIPSKKKRKTEETISDVKKHKSATYEALQAIYNRTLADYCTTSTPKLSPTNNVQCICGSLTMKDTATCVDCDKLQHGLCLGWRKELGPYRCPQCWEKCDLLETGGTLIVAPIVLRQQWSEEINTHLKAGLKVLSYEGYSASNRYSPMYPTELQQYDIVISTYNVLQSELRLTKTGATVSLRRKRKYSSATSPLLRLNWWRLCLDEAQTVETPGTNVSLMAQKITARHRWAVTGTPMAKGISDVFGLIDYLQMVPYNDVDTWKRILYDPYLRGDSQPMFDVLSKVLWRTSKNSVLDQINIPKQTYELIYLELSAVEKFFYNRQHEMCANNFLYYATRFDPSQTLEKMDKSALKNLMSGLLCLRQACSDPGTVTGKGRYMSLRKPTSSMKDLLKALILKNRDDCEESLRLMISAINGLAGVYLLMHDTEKAVEEYRKVLQLVAKYSQEKDEQKLNVDKLQIIHAMHNLAEVFTYFTPKERTLRDDNLIKDCAELEEIYIGKYINETTSGVAICNTFTATVDEHEQAFVLKYGQWYSDGIDWVSVNGLDEDLFARIELMVSNSDVDFHLNQRHCRIIMREAYNWHIELDEFRDKVLEAIRELYKQDPESLQVTVPNTLVKNARDCHLRPDKKTKQKPKMCPLCVAEDLLKKYESQLYTVKHRIDEEYNGLSCWGAKLEEFILKSLLALLKQKNGDKKLIKDGKTHIQLIEALKKEFKEIRKLWTLLDKQICSKDELDICKIRLQLKTVDENQPKMSRALKALSYEQQSTCENIHLFNPSEVPIQEVHLKGQIIEQNSRLKFLLGTRNYLATLQQQQFEGCTPDPCPICQCPLLNTWVILSCAHNYCLECFQQLLDKAIQFQIQCCVCRSKQRLEDVAYIGAGANNPQLDCCDVKVLGNYSTKVEAVVKLLIRLKKTDQSVKVLLFSTWVSVLKLLTKALEQNGILSEYADSAAMLQKRIDTFKDLSKSITVLLLPINLGGKGLNLIEATNVIILEPLLNPADESQAIGRIHRIGQTKPTIVHKFLVRNTIEESLHNATTSDASNWDKSKVTIGQLQGLFQTAVPELNGDSADECQN